VLVSLDIIN